MASAALVQAPLWDFMPTNVIRLHKPKKARPERVRTIVGRFLHLGAGVQSSTLVEMIVEGDLPPVDAVLFADTGNEPRHVYEQVIYLAGRLQSVNIPLIITRKPQSGGIMSDIMSAKGRFATMPLYTRSSETGEIGILRRQCTNEYKIIPCDDYLLDWMIQRDHAKRNKAGARRVNYNARVENIYGISADEKYRQGKRGAKWQTALYPLIDKDMGRGDCVAYLIRKKLPIPKKSSCIICPYHDDAHWLDMQQNTPHEFALACLFDDWLRSPESEKTSFKQGRKHDETYLHPSCQPLREIDFTARIEARKTGQIDMFKRELIAGTTCASDGGFSCLS